MVADKNERRQGSVGENSSDARYVPSDEKKDKVKTAAKKKANGPRDTTLKGQQRAQPPPAQAPPSLPPKEPTSAPFQQGEGAMLYGLEGQRKYDPPGPFQSTVSLNLDSVRNERDAFFAGLPSPSWPHSERPPLP